MGGELEFDGHFPICEQFSHQIRVKIGEIRLVKRLKYLVEN